MKPFFFNHVFRLNENLKPPQGIALGTVPVIVIEDVLQDPQGARETIGSSPATNWSYPEGPRNRNFVDYYDCRLRFPVFPPIHLIALAQRAIQAGYGVSVTPHQPAIDVNWFMQINEKPADHACPHHDALTPGKRSFTCLLYLNSPDECSGGTSFFRFRQTQSLVKDERFEAVLKRDERLQSSELDYWPPDPEVYWENVGTVSMVTGRMAIFPAQYFHAAFHPQDSFFDFPRLTMVFWMVS